MSTRRWSDRLPTRAGCGDCTEAACQRRQTSQTGPPHRLSGWSRTQTDGEQKSHLLVVRTLGSSLPGLSRSVREPHRAAGLYPRRAPADGRWTARRDRGRCATWFGCGCLSVARNVKPEAGVTSATYSYTSAVLVDSLNLSEPLRAAPTMAASTVLGSPISPLSCCGWLSRTERRRCRRPRNSAGR
jgi:hypothetical protein